MEGVEEVKARYDEPVDKLGRPSIWSTLGMMPDEFYALYRKCGTRKALAEKLGVCERTVTNIFRNLDIKPLKKRRPPQSSIPKWVAANPGVKLPRNMEEIAKITGLKVGGVRSYYWRRKQRAQKWLKNQLSLKELDHLIIDRKGARVPPRAIDTYEVFVNKWTMEVAFKGIQKSGQPFKLEFTWLQAEELVRRP